MKIPASIPALLIALLTFAGCNQPSSPPVTGEEATLRQLLVNVPGVEFPSRTALQLKAWGVYSDGRKVDLTAQARWVSLDASVARVGPSGIAQLDGAGLARFEVTYDRFVVPVEVQVNAAQLVSLTLTAQDEGALAMGDARRFTARARFDDGTSLDVTDRATWRSDGRAFDVSDVPGMIVGRAQGTGQLRADYFSQEAAVMVSVGAPRFTGLALTAPAATIKPGDTHRLSLWARSSDGSRREITNEAAWSSSNPDVAELTMERLDRGVLFARGVGSTTITARWQDQATALQLVVVPHAIVGLSFQTSQVQLALGRSTGLDLFAQLDDGNAVQVTQAASWVSSQPAVAEVSNEDGERGAVRAAAEGVATITAWYAGHELSYQVEVTPAELERLGATLTGGRLGIGQTAEFIIGGSFSDGSTLNLSTAAVVQHGTGLVSGVAHGRVRVTGADLGTALLDVTIGNVSSQLSFEVTDAALTSVVFVDDSQRLPWGPTGSTAVHQLRALGTYADGVQVDVTELCNWWVGDANVALLSDEPGRRGSFELAAGGETSLSVYIAGNIITSLWTFPANP